MGGGEGERLRERDGQRVQCMLGSLQQVARAMTWERSLWRAATQAPKHIVSSKIFRTADEPLPSAPELSDQRTQSIAKR